MLPNQVDCVLVAHGVHEFNEAGIIPSVVEHVWDVNPVLDEGSGVGLLLKAMIGYNGNPSLTEVVAYVGYWTVLLLLLWRSRVRAERGLAWAAARGTGVDKITIENPTITM
jgi:high-affinity Fe2+/Pb2+ permease